MNREVDESVVIVGHMGPMRHLLGEKGITRYWAVERNPCIRAYRALSDLIEYVFLGRAETVIVTGATLANDTIDVILSMVKGRVVLVGPTAGCHPKSLLKSGVYFVMRTHITDVESVVKALKLGGHVGGGSWGFVKGGEPYGAVLKRVRCILE